MGEYAEMMLDGTCCQNCGEFMGDETGYPRRCESCQLQIKHLKKKKAKNKQNKKYLELDIQTVDYQELKYSTKRLSKKEKEQIND